MTRSLALDLPIRHVEDRSGYSLLSYPTTNRLPEIVALPAMAQAILPSCYVGGLGRVRYIPRKLTAPLPRCRR
jgi:hypothetical protein